MKKHLFLIAAYHICIASAVGQSILGVDVSHHNNTINWHTVYLAGRQFAFVKASEGVTVQDDHFSTNMTSSNPDGVVLGAYHLAHPNNNPAASTEVSNFLTTAGASAYIGAGHLPPALDLEPADAPMRIFRRDTHIRIWLNG